MKIQSRHIIVAVMCAVMLVSCQKSCGKPTEEKVVESGKVLPSVPHKKQATPPEDVANLNYDGLSDAQIASINKLLNEEICPCGCPTTFAKCLTLKDDGCKPATLMANWAIKQMKEGAPEHLLYRAISEEISTGFLAKERTIDTKKAYRKGNPNAPYIIVEFADFECPACKLSAKAVKSFIDDNKDDVQIYFMHFPLSTHPHAERAAIAAEAAGKQGKFWDMHDLLFAHESALTDAAILNLAKGIFNKNELDKFQKDLADPALLKKIKEHKDYGLNTLNLSGTPTFMFNGRPYNLSSAKDGYQLRLDMEKARKAINCQVAAD